MTIAVSGANGFVGTSLINALCKSGKNVYPITRNQLADRPNGAKLPSAKSGKTSLSDLLTNSSLLHDVDCFIHLAGATKTPRLMSPKAREMIQRSNVDLSLSLAEVCAEAGVKRFIFLSSIKVHGETTEIGRPFSRFDHSAPKTFYAETKLRAEIGLKKISANTGLEVVVVRPPLIYGPGARGNFRHLVMLVSSGFPLPLACIENRRSMISLENLIDFLMIAIEHPKAANETFLLSDDDDLSTPELLHLIAAKKNMKPTTFCFPTAALKSSFYLLGLGDLSAKIISNMEVDIKHTLDVLNWKPRISVGDAIGRAVSEDDMLNTDGT